VASDNDAVAVSRSGTWADDTRTRGSYTVTYTAADPAGNTVSVTRTIEVVDTETPEIALIGNAVDTVARWASYTDPGVEVDDYCNGSSEITVTLGGTFVNTQSMGLYTITYVATDGSGNTSGLITRYILVGTSSIRDMEASQQLVVYPNPTQGSVFLVFNQKEETTANLVVYAVHGQELYREMGLTLSEGKVKELDLGHLPAGMYRVVLQGKDFTASKNLIVR
jgi:hypothetical protein